MSDESLNFIDVFEDLFYSYSVDLREAFIALNLIDGIGPIKVRHLLDYFGDAPSILKASKSQLIQVRGIGEDSAESIYHWEQRINLNGELKRLEKLGGYVLIPQDEEYPPLLKQIYDPPIVLYVKGKIKTIDRNPIAIVGSRLTTPYGIDVARKLAFELAGNSVTIVSGGARGIDTSAHKGALQAQGRSIVVLGTGLDIIFPPENLTLFEQCAASGAVITQFPFGRKADKQTFPIRNRIVAGMSLGTVVVEANQTSGALITANMAVDYGRQVFAVPGRIDSPRSRGCHELIKSGAKLCENAQDILGEFEYLFPKLRHSEPLESAARQSLSTEEVTILNAIGSDEKQIDDIIQITGLPTSRVHVVLLGLELKKRVRQAPGKLYQQII